MIARSLFIAALLSSASGTAIVGTTAYAATDGDAFSEKFQLDLPADSNLNVSVKDRVAHIFGHARADDIERAKQIALSSDGIDRVIVTASAVN